MAEIAVKRGNAMATDELMWPRILKDAYALHPAEIGRKLPQQAVKLFNAMKHWTTDPTLPSSRGDEDIGEDAFSLGPGLMLGAGFARAGIGAAGSELGATAAQILHRTDALKLIARMKAENKSPRQIADALNERFAPILDEGQKIRPDHAYHAAGRNPGRPRGTTERPTPGETELGAMGGGGSTKLARITADDVVRIADELGLSTRVKGSKTGTEYVKVHDEKGGPVDSRYGTPKKVEVRVASESDPHGGRMGDVWKIDTEPGAHSVLTHQHMDAAGDLYKGNPPAIRDRLSYVFGKQKPAPEPAPPPPEPADPRQLKLLAGGLPPISPEASFDGDRASRSGLVKFQERAPQNTSPEDHADAAAQSNDNMRTNTQYEIDTRLAELSGRLDYGQTMRRLDEEAPQPQLETFLNNVRGNVAQLPPGFVLDPPNNNAMRSQ